LDNTTQVSILTGDGPGFTPDDPMALVRCPPSPKPAKTEKRYRLKAKYNRRLYFPNIHSMKMLRIVFTAFYASDPEWLGFTVGETFTYDGIVRFREYYGPSAYATPLQ
jgi:hypothetical protein